LRSLPDTTLSVTEGGVLFFIQAYQRSTKIGVPALPDLTGESEKSRDANPCRAKAFSYQREREEVLFIMVYQR
jgi:hypothetical protein